VWCVVPSSEGSIFGPGGHEVTTVGYRVITGGHEVTFEGY
jgi:hypothetical protein